MSLRLDVQGKTYAQELLHFPVTVTVTVTVTRALMGDAA